MSNSTPKSKFPLAFFVLTFILSIPFYILVALASNNIVFTPDMGFLFITLVALAPIAAALILTFKENGWDGAKKLLRRASPGWKEFRKNPMGLFIILSQEKPAKMTISSQTQKILNFT